MDSDSPFRRHKFRIVPPGLVTFPKEKKPDDTVDTKTMWSKEAEREMPPLRTWAVYALDLDGTTWGWEAVEGHVASNTTNGDLMFQRHVFVPQVGGVVLFAPIIYAAGEWRRVREVTDYFITQMAPS